MKCKSLNTSGGRKYEYCEIAEAPEPLKGDFLEISTEKQGTIYINKGCIETIVPGRNDFTIQTD